MRDILVRQNLQTRKEFVELGALGTANLAAIKTAIFRRVCCIVTQQSQKYGRQDNQVLVHRS